MGPHASVRIDINSGATVDAVTGWPTSGDAIISFDTFEPNSWPMTWTGPGSVAINLPGASSPPLFNVVTGTDRILLTTSGRIDSLSIRPVSTATQAGQFTTSFASRANKAKCVRFMDGLYTNGPTNVAANPGMYLQTENAPLHYYHHGWTWSQIVDLSHVAQSDVWVNVHHLRYNDSAYLTAMATALAGCYGKCYVEFSNETWNSAFPVYAWLSTVAGGQDILGWYADRADLVSEAFKAVAGSGKFVGVLGSQAVAPSLFSRMITNATRPLNFLDAIAIAPYWGGSWAYNASPATVMATSFADMSSIAQADFNTNWKPYISQWATHATSRSWALLAYEYGGHFTMHPGVSRNDPAWQRLYDYGRSPEAAPLYAEFHSFWEGIGGGLACHFADVDAAEWGRKRTELETSPAWEEIASRMNP